MRHKEYTEAATCLKWTQCTLLSGLLVLSIYPEGIKSPCDTGTRGFWIKWVECCNARKIPSSANDKEFPACLATVNPIPLGAVWCYISERFKSITQLGNKHAFKGLLVAS